MAIKRYKPTSSGRRQRTDLGRETITKDKPEKSLSKGIVGPVGRSKGKVSTRHRQRGAKKLYRQIDFKRDKRDIEATVKSIEYDPNRTANIALLCYKDGEKRYILAPQGLKVGDTVVAGESVEINLGNALPLSKIQVGTAVHNIELSPGYGGQLARSAGTHAVITAKEDKYVLVKLSSGEVRKILGDCYATLGSLSNPEWKNITIGKAGRKRYMGRRPETRGVAFSSPRDHPHGGAYKTSGVGLKHPKTPWGKPARGVKTRKKKKSSNRLIVKRRK